MSCKVEMQPFNPPNESSANYSTFERGRSGKLQSSLDFRFREDSNALQSPSGKFVTLETFLLENGNFF